MRIFNTAHLDEKSSRLLSSNETAWIYNGLDCCVTANIFSVLTEQLENNPENVKETYKTALAKNAPIMEMALRGTKINEMARQETILELTKTLNMLEAKFQRLCEGVVGGPINYNSPTQVKGLFYTSLGLKEIRKRNTKGVFMPTVNEEALEQLQKYLNARPFCKFILMLRDIKKQISFLKTEVDKDGRMRTFYNIAGTNTGRLSSSMSDFGTGTNLQNVNRSLRYPFEADAGMYMVNIDLEQADGRNVGAICWDLFVDDHGPEFAGSYLDACESGDLHTAVCRMVWPELDWPDDQESWKDFCDGLIAHGQDSYRQLSKKGGHGTNYYGTPRTMAKHLHTNAKVIENFQNLYFGAFPCIPKWHDLTINQVKEKGVITTLFGRRRTFFGRANDATTHRQAIAYAPQSMTGEQIDRALLAVWRKYPQVQLLNQVHDSILLQLPFSEATELIPKVLETMKIELTLKQGRKFFVPLDAAGGWNWGYATKSNSNGLKKWTGKEERDAPSPLRRLNDYLKNVKIG